MLPARIVHVSIQRDWREVYAFVADPANMAQWARGLGAGLKPDGEEWIADGGVLGEVRVRFAPRNEFGVVDHDVTMPNGDTVHNALRVSPNGDGAEVMFLLLRRPDMDDKAIADDAAEVERDLQTLRGILER
jgi:hypothetical protein